MKYKGGFLPLIAAALASIIGGIAGGFIERGIAGKGIYAKKKKKKKAGGLYLNPYSKKTVLGCF